MGSIRGAYESSSGKQTLLDQSSTLNDEIAWFTVDPTAAGRVIDLGRDLGAPIAAGTYSRVAFHHALAYVTRAAKKASDGRC